MFIGELCVSGDGLARGYLNRARIYNRKIYRKSIYKLGERMYKQEI